MTPPRDTPPPSYYEPPGCNDPEEEIEENVRDEYQEEIDRQLMDDKTPELDHLRGRGICESETAALHSQVVTNENITENQER